eukprot:COSAG06_NODE_61157_length_268_cov_1.201183_1_plen_53_part_01
MFRSERAPDMRIRALNCIASRCVLSVREEFGGTFCGTNDLPVCILLLLLLLLL